MKKRKYPFDDDDEPVEPTWPAVRDLFSGLIVPAKDWLDAELIAEPREMAGHFIAAYPEAAITMEDLRLALHDLRIPFERNEHNSKFYYLAKWR